MPAERRAALAGTAAREAVNAQASNPLVRFYPLTHATAETARSLNLDGRSPLSIRWLSLRNLGPARTVHAGYLRNGATARPGATKQVEVGK